MKKKTILYFRGYSEIVFFPFRNDIVELRLELDDDRKAKF
jgi:hypothetical protein